jgi:hypothetical protein
LSSACQLRGHLPSATMDTEDGQLPWQIALFASLEGGSGDAGDSMAEEDDDYGDSDGGACMDEEEDILEEECPEPLATGESFALLPDDVFAAAHTGDSQVVRAFLADPRGDVNARDRPPRHHAITLTLTQALTWP